jgi:hypothetical protein
LGFYDEHRLMDIIICEISVDTEIGDFGAMTDRVTATCTKCGHETSSWGTSERSIKGCLALMNEECPEGHANFYVEEQ